MHVRDGGEGIRKGREEVRGNLSRWEEWRENKWRRGTGEERVRGKLHGEKEC